MASLISRIERSISASSRSSTGGSVPSTPAWMVEANTSEPSESVVTSLAASSFSADSQSTAITDTLSHLVPPLRKACSTSSGTASETALFDSMSTI